MGAADMLRYGTFFSVNILFTSECLRTRAIKGKYLPGKCEHPVKISASFTSLYLFSNPNFTKKCEQYYVNWADNGP